MAVDSPAVGRTSERALGVVGTWTVRLDPASLVADVTMQREAMAQPPQALGYQIEIADFLAPRDFEVTAVRRGLGDALEVLWRHRHPFPAPNLANPITAKNRADLGYTGYLVLVSDTITGSFFGNTLAVSSADAIAPDVYVPIGDLRNPASPEDRLFPAWLLVDEVRDSRENVSNNGVMAGSYDVPGGGWQQSNLGASGIDWTGFDYLHGGQSTTGMFSFHLPPATGAIEFEIAILAKWTDPRGQGGMTRRLPPSPADVSAFAYRLPYSALDQSQIIAPGVLEFDATGATPTNIATAIRDWDAQASQAVSANLGAESDVSLIQPNAQGSATVRLEIFGQPPLTFPTVGGTGAPLDPFRYGASVSPGALTPGTSWGLIEAVDPEDDDPLANTYRFGVEPGTLAATPERALPIRSYQLVRTLVANPSGELLFATRASGLTGGGTTSLVQLLPGPVATVAGSSGTVYGTAMAELLSPMAGELLMVSPSGGLSGLERTAEAYRRRRPLQDVGYAHPSAAWGAVAAYPGVIPFLAIEASNPPQLVLGDFLTGQKQVTFTGLPKELPSLTVSGESLYADLAGPDWSLNDSGLAVVSLGTGISVAAALPPLKATGNLYTFDPGTANPTFTKLTTISDTSTSQGVFYPDWSADGTQLVCTRIEVNLFNLPASFKLATCDASTGSLTNLDLSLMGAPPAPATAYIPIQPVFNRTGRKIAFAALEVSLTNQQIYDADIWVLDLDAPPASRLTNVSRSDSFFEAYPVFR